MTFNGLFLCQLQGYFGKNMNNTTENQLGPIEMVVLQGTAYCNLNCSYCYLSEESRQSKGAMSTDVIQKVAENILSSKFTGKHIRFSWHSGEPMVLKPDYYKEAMSIILETNRAINGSNVKVDFDIQTNGTLINEAWCKLILEMEGLLLIGVSCDGPAALHNIYRTNWSGRPSHSSTERGMKLLASNNIQFDITAVISPESLSQPKAFLEYFSKFKSHIREFHYNLHDEFFIEDIESPVINEYANKYKQFILDVLNLISTSPPKHYVAISNFSSFYNRLFIPPNQRPDYSARAMSAPLKTISVETNGDMTTFYAGLTKDECGDLINLFGDGKGFVIGNLLDQSLSDIVTESKFKAIQSDFEISHAACENNCDFYEVCSGGYNLIKYRRFKNFNQTETPECKVHVKTFVETLLHDININTENSQLE